MNRAVVVGLVLIAIHACLLATQVPQKDAPAFVLKGPDLPKFWVVRALFLGLWDDYTAKDNLKSCRGQLGLLGITEGSPAEEVLTKALLQAIEIIDRKAFFTEPPENPKAFEEAQLRAFREQVRDLRRVYVHLKADLKANGVVLGLLDSYLEERCRPTTVIASDSPLDALLMVASEFEATSEEDQP